MCVLLPVPPGVWHAADNRAEHESRDEGEEHQVDEALQSVVAQSCHGLDVVLQHTNRSDHDQRRVSILCSNQLTLNSKE